MLSGTNLQKASNKNILSELISSNPMEIINDIEYTEKDRKDLVKFSDKYVRPTKNATLDIVDFIYKII